MNLRTYHAPSIADALGQIKRDLGSSAVILHTRTYKRGGFLGFGGRTAVEVTASSNVNVVNPLVRKGKAPVETLRPREESLRRAYGAAPLKQVESPAEAPPRPATDEYHPAAREVASAVVAAATVESPDANLMRDELASIKRLVGQVLRTNGGKSGPALPESLTAMYLRLIESEVAAEIADAVVAEVRDELTARDLDNADRVRECVLRRLEQYVAVSECVPDPGQMPDGRPLTIALVGPTGVGKTTTIAKLAATYKLRHGKRVGLVTCDTYRIAAVEQLRTYANIIGLRLNVALTPPEMGACCSSLSDCDVILIDTAGRSQHDGDRLTDLGALLDAAKPHETHLVLSGAASESVLLRAAERFEVAKPNRVILTKLDETVSFGVLVNVAHRIGKSLSYITTGQEVPDHIEPGRADRLAQLVLDGSGVR